MQINNRGLRPAVDANRDIEDRKADVVAMSRDKSPMIVPDLEALLADPVVRNQALIELRKFDTSAATEAMTRAGLRMIADKHAGKLTPSDEAFLRKLSEACGIRVPQTAPVAHAVTTPPKVVATPVAPVRAAVSTFSPARPVQRVARVETVRPYRGGLADFARVLAPLVTGTNNELNPPSSHSLPMALAMIQDATTKREDLKFSYSPERLSISNHVTDPLKRTITITELINIDLNRSGQQSLAPSWNDPTNPIPYAGAARTIGTILGPYDRQCTKRFAVAVAQMIRDWPLGFRDANERGIYDFPTVWLRHWFGDQPIPRWDPKAWKYDQL